MPVILLTIDANNAGALAALTRTVGALADVDAAITRTVGATDGLSAAFTRVQTILDATQARLDAISAAVDRASASYSQMGAALDQINGQYATLGMALATQADGFGKVAAAADLATASIRAQIGALGDLAVLSRVTSTGGIPLNTTAGRAIGADVAVAEGNRLGAFGRALGGAAAGDVGLGGRLVGAALGPGGLGVGLGLYGAFKAAQAGAGFQSAEQQTIAQIGGTTATAAGRDNIARGQAAAQTILDFTTSGKSPYTATNLMGGVEPLLAHGYGKATITQGITTTAELAGQNGAPDISNAVNAVNTYLALIGAGAKSSAAQMKDAGDYFSKLETQTTIKPGQLTPAMTNVLASAIGTGLTPEQLGGGFVKIGTANANAAQDAMTYGRMIQEMLVKNTPGARNAAAQLGLAMGPGALAAYGGSWEAMLQAYNVATAGPNQAKLISELFPTSGVRGGATAFKELIAGGGTQQALGYEVGLANRAGAGQQAYQQYSQGIDQQTTQLSNQFNANLILLGNTLNQTVVPALLKLGSDALLAANNLVQSGASVLAGPGGKGGIGASIAGAAETGFDFINPFGGTFGKIDAARNASAQTWITGAGKQILQGSVGPGVLPSTFIGPLAPGEQRRPALSSNFIGPLAPGEERASSTALTSASHGVSLSFAGLGTASDALSSVFVGLAGAADQINRNARQQAALATTTSKGSLDLATQNARGQLNADLLGGASAGTLSSDLRTVSDALKTSAYSPGQQAGILAQESFKVRAATRGPADEAAVSGAQQNLDAAQLMHDTPAQLKTVQDAYLAALTQLYRDTETGTKLAASLRGVAQQGAVYNDKAQTDSVTRTVKDFQDAISVDKLQGNLAAQHRDQGALLAYQKRNAGILGLDAADLALLSAQNTADFKTPVVNTKPFFETNPGLGGLEAGFGSTAVRLGGGVDPQTAEIRKLTAELAAANTRNTALLAQIAANTAAQQGVALPASASGHRSYRTG